MVEQNWILVVWPMWSFRSEVALPWICESYRLEDLRIVFRSIGHQHLPNQRHQRDPLLFLIWENYVLQGAHPFSWSLFFLSFKHDLRCCYLGYVSQPHRHRCNSLDVLDEWYPSPKRWFWRNLEYLFWIQQLIEEGMMLWYPLQWWRCLE